MQTVTSHDGTTIAFDVSGKGKPLILIGGALSSRAADMPLSGLLASHFTVISYDRRGRGDSGDTPPYAVEREIEDIAALIQAVGGSAYVFGLSSGAVLALEAAAKLGHAISTLVLFEPPFNVDESRPPLPEDYVDHLTKLLSEGRRADAVEYFMAAAVGVPAEIIAEMRQTPMWPALEAVAPTLLYDQAVMDASQQGNSLRSELMEAVMTPTIVMDGGASPAWMRNAVQATVDALPNARRHTLVGQTHAVGMEAPDVLARAITEFLTG